MIDETNEISIENDKKQEYKKLKLLAIKKYCAEEIDEENIDYEISSFRDLEEMVYR